MDPDVLTALFAFLPRPWGGYAASAVGVAGILSILAGVVAAQVKPPAATAPAWLRTAYQVVTWPALNLGWARNAVVPGMPHGVQVAALQAAKLAAAFPEAQVVAPLGTILTTDPTK